MSETPKLWRRRWRVSDEQTVETRVGLSPTPDTGWWYELTCEQSGVRIDHNGWYGSDRGAKMAARNSLFDGNRSGLGWAEPLGPWEPVTETPITVPTPT